MEDNEVIKLLFGTDKNNRKNDAIFPFLCSCYCCLYDTKIKDINKLLEILENYCRKILNNNKKKGDVG